MRKLFIVILFWMVTAASLGSCAKMAFLPAELAKPRAPTLVSGDANPYPNSVAQPKVLRPVEVSTKPGPSQAVVVPPPVQQNQPNVIVQSTQGRQFKQEVPHVQPSAAKTINPLPV